jgi:hypothetical protein
VTEVMLRELFTQIISACEGYSAAGGPPVLHVQLRATTSSTGIATTFAFVEFRDEEISATISTFNGMELYGRNLKISHPNGYVAPPVPVKVRSSLPAPRVPSLPFAGLATASQPLPPLSLTSRVGLSRPAAHCSQGPGGAVRARHLRGDAAAGPRSARDGRQEGSRALRG